MNTEALLDLSINKELSQSESSDLEGCLLMAGAQSLFLRGVLQYHLATKFYFEESEKRFRGRPRESIVPTLNKDINRAKSINRNFPIPTLRRKEDFEHIRSL